MSSVKRKLPPANLLQRRVKPRYEPEPESDFDDDVSEGPSEEGAGSLGSGDEDEELSGELGSGSDEGDSEAGSDEEGMDNEDDDAPQIDASQLSFGALAKAQAAMDASSKRKRRGGGGAAADDDDDAQDDKGWEKPRPSAAKKPEKRSSKHAPVEMTSKRQVSRKRDFLAITAETKKPQARDPRFMPLGAGAGASKAGIGSGNVIDEIKVRKAYAFLDDYRASEMQDLRAAIKKTKNPADKEKLQKALTSMESRKKAQDRRDRERAVIEEHRKKEKELVAQGKTPFYLKRSEQKKRVLVDQFKGLKKKDADRAIERRRKKVAGKEKKMLPMARRGAEDR
ncbi:hypothetical protein C8A05DRAFT_16335 [Staphylotrichum tortipilum]|uniref:rRNA biogenesis protein RRP36 n=1 Tax=Staphylotrichum tortipilum TaxID=2831512 RepID=A0AAN6MJS3_9PEZI|nr:hypothetical protein C8A05DRAFT_16335 [Staphylotrichum longicolle]